MSWQDRPDVVAFVYQNGRCQVCKKVGHWVPHHKWPRSRGDDYHGDVDAPDNLVMACPDCHGQWHAGMGAHPSASPSKAPNHARNLKRLIRRWPLKNWLVMAPQYVIEAYAKFG